MNRPLAVLFLSAAIFGLIHFVRRFWGTVLAVEDTIRETEEMHEGEKS
jgi:hypothetical protein